MELVYSPRIKTAAATGTLVEQRNDNREATPLISLVEF